MALTKPYGDARTATIMVIGHDPCLQDSPAQAEYAFFLDYLTRDVPTLPAEQRKYGLAQAVVDYVSHLAGRKVALSDMYVANLCNEYLTRNGKGTVLIPGAVADRGIAAIREAVASVESLRIILPMAVQPFYHLCRKEFVDDRPELIGPFLVGAHPRPEKAAEFVYQQSGRAPFLAVCGQLFHHGQIPVVPIMHVKQWPLRKRFYRYEQPMASAATCTRQAVGGPVRCPRLEADEA